MSNNSCEEYWKSLENSSVPNEMAKMGQAMKLLIQAYKEDLPVYVACQYTNAEGTEAKQLYSEVQGKRAYLCFTSRKKFLESGMNDAECEQISTRTMVDNVMSKSPVFGFVFNLRCGDMTLIPMELLIGYMIGS